MEKYSFRCQLQSLSEPDCFYPYSEVFSNVVSISRRIKALSDLFIINNLEVIPIESQC